MIHLAHFLDGYPLCWSQDRDGDHESTTDETKVTCGYCRRIAQLPELECSHPRPSRKEGE